MNLAVTSARARPRSERSACGERFLFLCRRYPAKGLVTARKATKSDNLVAVPLGEVGVVRLAKLAKFGDRAVLHDKIFAVHQRHQQESAPFLRRGMAPTAIQRLDSKFQCKGIGHECLGAAAKDISTELVKQDDRRGDRLQRLTPAPRLDIKNVLPKQTEARCYGGVERFVLGKPALLANFAEPEI